MTSNSLVTWSASLIWARAWRRAWRSLAPRRDRVTSFSITGRRSLALGSVVLICSCLISAAVMLPHIALRCEAVRLSLRPWLRWRMANVPKKSVLVFVTLGEVFDILRRPARHFHAQMQAHFRQHRLDLVQRLAAEIRRAEHFRLGLLDQIADVNDIVVLEAVGRTHRQF